MKSILITGGAGYIGSHVCKALKHAGYEPITFDNLSHGHPWAVKWGPLFKGDLHSCDDLDQVFSTYDIQAVIHMAGSIHLRESLTNPFNHYHNNISGTLFLLNAMVKHEIKTLVYSSSAAVYAPPEYIPMDESHPKRPCNPYGKTKWMIEQIIKDFENAHGLNSLALRYFNASGADIEGEIGEAHDPETHLIPRILLTACGKQKVFTLFWDQHNTPDGSAIRDFIHVSDLAEAHVKSMEWILTHKKSDIFNLGTGLGYSVLEVIQKARKITGCEIPVKVLSQKIAESPSLVANSSYAQKNLNWKPKFSDLETILQTAWAWHHKHILVEI